MAPVPVIVDGPNILTQNVVYVMPGKSKWILSDAVLATAVTSGGTYTAIAATTTSGALLPGACFVKATTGTTNCVVSNQ